MDGIQKWWSALDRARKLMLGALVLMTLSQFANYQGAYVETEEVAIGPVGGGTGVVPNFSTGVAIAHVGNPIPGIKGWALHPNAWLPLGALLLLFATGLDLGQWWKQWGYWIGVAGLAFCVFPFDLEVVPGIGLGAGVLAIAGGVWAARVHRRAAKIA